MKVTSDVPKFVPITIVLETEKEYVHLTTILNEFYKKTVLPTDKHFAQQLYSGITREREKRL